MQTINRGYRGVSVLVKLNIDRMMFTGALVLALYVGAYVGTM